MITTDDLRERYFRNPFQPFRIVLRDGRELFVESPSSYAISPTGKTMTFAPRIEDFEIIDMPDIASLEPGELAIA